MSFTTLALTGGRVLVKGTDSTGTEGQTVLDGSEWAQAKRQVAHAEAHEDFDQLVTDFFAPLLEAQEKLEATLSVPQLDQSSYFVIDEGEEATAGRAPTIIKLGKDSIVLRLLEEGKSDRLVWVNDELEILEVLPGTGDVHSDVHSDVSAGLPAEG
jgi:hypothetical protein